MIAFEDQKCRSYPFTSIVLPADADQFIHIPTGDDTGLLRAHAFEHSLPQIGLTVSTGPVVDFRLRDHLLRDPGRGTVPLLYPGHFSSAGLQWPRPGFRKPNAILDNRETRKWLYPSGFYTVARRFTAKEERRRVVAHVVDPKWLATSKIGFENHLNVFHEGGQPLPELLAHGLAAYLNCTIFDQYLRRFSAWPRASVRS